MRTTHILSLLICMCFFMDIPLKAQSTCGPEAEVDTSAFEGTAFFNYGCTSRAKTNTYKTAFALGQTFVGYTENVTRNSSLGFYARYFLPPFATKVKATQGELLDRIQVTWEIDALGPSPSEGFNLYRDGIFLAKLEGNIRSYNDFNVVAGRPYTYCVRGINIFGEGVESCALGFQVPNGVVTGRISTINGTPVPGASVTLTPMQGFSAMFEDGDGALALEDTLNPFLPGAGQDFSITFWIKTDTAGSTPGKLIGMPGLYIRSRPTTVGGDNGIAVATTPGGTAFLASYFTNNQNAWHHVALTYDAASAKGRLYFDGQLVVIAPMAEVATPAELSFGERAGPGLWVGRMDEVRIYHRKLDELDFDYIMDGTASSQTPYLSHYWKMDEELGLRSYDIMRRQILYFCPTDGQPMFDADRPPVHTAGITNENGFYIIESVSYGDLTSFTALPKKNFYKHRALKFERAEQDYATLPDFSMTDQATIELWVNSAGPDGNQTLLFKRWGTKTFRLFIAPVGTNNEIRISINGATANVYGQLESGYHHLAFTLDSNAQVITGYKDGQLMNSFSYSGLTGNWSDPANPWLVGTNYNGTTNVNFFGGLIDEIAIYDNILPVSTIQQHATSSRDIQEDGLRVYYAMDEGSGTTLNNAGSELLDRGTTHGTSWSPLAANQVIEAHLFNPDKAYVTLNPSVTSVDKIDFVDRSTIGVSGYVRYTNTDCFAKNVEILVNGQSFSPQIFTDSTGRFVIDFDPGMSAILTPVFPGHTFIPAFWEITNLSSPIAGILFNDMTLRTLSGQVAGNEICRTPIIANPPGTSEDTRCRVQVRTVDGCLEREILVTNQDGHFEFTGLPPSEKLTVSIIEFSNQTIKQSFDVQGGHTVDLSEDDTTGIDFIYTAPPQVKITSGLDTVPDCQPPVILMDQGQIVILKAKPFEQYEKTYDVNMVTDDGVCFIDTAEFHILNGIAEEDTVISITNGIMIDTFIVGAPNPAPPHLKTLQIIVENVKGEEGSTTKQILVTGIKAKLESFSTIMPEIPSLILRDPPGDGSYSFLEKNEKFCKTTVMISDSETGGGGGPKLYLGGEIQIVSAPLGVGTIEAAGVIFDINPDVQATYERLSSNSFETCYSFDSRIATSDDDLIVGGERGGDVFMGDAINLVFSRSDLVTFNNCEGVVEEVIGVQPGEFSTIFIYSQFYIEGFLIPALEDIVNDPQTDPAQLPRITESIARWEAILQSNKDQKAATTSTRNISFDAGSEYAYSETSDTTTTETITNLANTEFKLESNIGYEFNKFGLVANLRLINNTSNGSTDETGKSKGVTTGFVLYDNDPGDAFTIDIGKDNVYKTPVFNLKAGQSNCPWEPGTANREGTNMVLYPGYDQLAINVPSHEPAVFKFLLGNESATNEAWTYYFTAIAESNPHGAIIKLNGQPLNYLQSYEIGYGETDTATITIERGPEEYDYEGLLVAELSACEYERNLALTIDYDDDPKFFSGIELGVHFIRPCSEVTVNVPEQNWVITNASGPNLPITVTGYDLTNVEFQRIKVQYRRSDGNGAWQDLAGTITQRYNPNWTGYTNQNALGPIFTQFTWNTTGFSDGEYEIHAWAICDGGSPEGFSQVIKGRIDREPPKLVGLPEPSDGVLHAGDEISFTFNKPINCDQLWAATVIDHVNLYNTRTNSLMTTSVTCVDNKIVIEPTDQNMFFENDELRVELDNISDLTGNVLVHDEWRFLVDRNELAWLTDTARMTKYDDEGKSMMVKIHNRGGSATDFTITGAPNWMHVTPNAGTLVPNEIRDIQFTAGDSLTPGWLLEDVILTTVANQNPFPFFFGGSEKLPISLRTLCRPPAWDIDPADFQFSMTLITRLTFNGVLSNDPEDMVAAFIDGELRGVAKLTYAPTSTSWIAFLTIYGNNEDINKLVTYEIFDASACLRHPGFFASNPFTFTPNGTQGSPTNTRMLSTNGTVVNDIPLNKGWNWISFNVHFPDSTINKAMDQIADPVGDLIKDQNNFSVYTNNTWAGSLDTLGNTSMYMYQAKQPNNIRMTGTPLAPASNPILLMNGWNWIAYIPTFPLTVNAALITIPAQAGDMIKSQTQFAQYVNSTVGWVGNLKKMEPLKGYQLNLTTGTLLTYPSQPFTGHETDARSAEETLDTYWEINPSQFEHSMTFIGIFQYDDVNATTAEMELGAFAGNEIRGVAKAIYIEFLDAYMFFMTCYSNASGEQLHFKLYDAATGQIQNLSEHLAFLPNNHQGSMDAPLPFTLQITGMEDVDSELSFHVVPNPFRDETVCRIELPDAQEVRLMITDMDGKMVYNTVFHANAGMNNYVWKACSSTGSPLSSGIYFIRMETEQGVLTKKVMLQ